MPSPSAPLRSLRTAAVAALLLALDACRAVGPRDAADAGSPGGPLAAAALLRDPVFSRVVLSPDAKRIAGISAHRGRRAVFFYDVGRRKLEPLKVIETGTSEQAIGWSGPAALVVGFERAQRNRERETRMVAIRVDGWRPRDLGPDWVYHGHPLHPEGVIHWLPDEPEYVLLNWWSSDEEGASVRRVRVRDGLSSTLVAAVPGVNVWYADHRGAVRAGSGRSEEGITGTVYARVTEDAPFEELSGADPAQETEFEFAGFSADPRTIYVRAIAETGRKALYEFDLERRQRGVLRFAHPRVDVGALVHSPVDGALWAVEIEPDRPALHFLDARAKRVQASIDAALPGTRNRIVSSDRSGEFAIVEVSGDRTPPDYYFYDRERRLMEFLFTAVPRLDRAHLAEMRSVTYEARDGLEIPAYLTVPNRTVPASLPLIVIPHDGPSDRTHWGWDPVAQLFASRGFAVFQPNFRGSTGYGREHERRGYRQWGLAMQDDLADGVRWLVAQGIADPKRVGIFGVGYGGYAALLAAVKTPELFGAVASFGGVTDLVDLIENEAHYRSDEVNPPVVRALLREREQLEATSPARQAAHIRVPVLIGHGTEDPVVAIDQARAMANALEAAGAPNVETHLYRDEGHALRDERNRIDFYDKLAAFFARNLAATIEAL